MDAKHLEILEILVELQHAMRILEKENQNLKTRQSELESKIGTLQEILSDYDDVKENVEQLELAYGLSKFSNKYIELSDQQINQYFWRCSPKQHAIIQLMLKGETIEKIAERINTTEGGAKSQARWMYKRLGVRSKTDVTVNYRKIWEETDEQTYFERAHIPKDWAVKYGDMSLEQAKEQDEYYQAICVTRYRQS